MFDRGGKDGVAFILDLSKQKQAEAEIRALKDQLYRENLALRDEIDRAQMFEEIVGSSKSLKAVLSKLQKWRRPTPLCSSRVKLVLARN